MEEEPTQGQVKPSAEEETKIRFSHGITRKKGRGKAPCLFRIIFLASLLFFLFRSVLFRVILWLVFSWCLVPWRNDTMLYLIGTELQNTSSIARTFSFFGNHKFQSMFAWLNISAEHNSAWVMQALAVGM